MPICASFYRVLASHGKLSSRSHYRSQQDQTPLAVVSRILGGAARGNGPERCRGLRISLDRSLCQLRHGRRDELLVRRFVRLWAPAVVSERRAPRPSCGCPSSLRRSSAFAASTNSAARRSRIVFSPRSQRVHHGHRIARVTHLSGRAGRAPGTSLPTRRLDLELRLDVVRRHERPRAGPPDRSRMTSSAP
jgi:hypothetical protein